MKTKKYSQRIGLMLLSIFTFLLGCEKMDFTPEQEFSLREIYRDSAFLGFEGNLRVDSILLNNLEIYLPAFERMQRHLKIKDNRYTWDFENGVEIKISENIYDFITWLWKGQNKRLESGDYILKATEYGFCVIAKIEPEYPKAKTGQFIIPGAHGHNAITLYQLYKYAATDRYLSEYIENLLDYDVFRPSHSHVGKTNNIRWTYFCENACFYYGPRGLRCEHNIIGYKDDDVYPGEHFQKVRNIFGGTIVSLMNYERVIRYGFH